jgi:enhancer of polycomb-like protein
MALLMMKICVEESIRDALTGGFTYYMDERDKEWLDSLRKRREAKVPAHRVLSQPAERGRQLVARRHKGQGAGSHSTCGYRGGRV